jgi:hypothetical protein
VQFLQEPFADFLDRVLRGERKHIKNQTQSLLLRLQLYEDGLFSLSANLVTIMNPKFPVKLFDSQLGGAKSMVNDAVVTSVLCHIKQSKRQL